MPQAQPAPPTDFLSDVIARLSAAIAATAPESDARDIAIEKVEAELRHTYGNDRISIRLNHSTRDAAIRRDWLAGEHYALLERRYGLTKRRIQQIVKN